MQRAFESTSGGAAAQSQRAVEVEPVTEPVQQECPVCSYNEWDPLEEVIVGRAENAHVPPFTVEVKVSDIVKVTSVKHARLVNVNAQHQHLHDQMNFMLLSCKLLNRLTHMRSTGPFTRNMGARLFPWTT